MNERRNKKEKFGPTFDEIRDLHLKLVVIQSRRLPANLSLSLMKEAFVSILFKTFRFQSRLIKFSKFQNESFPSLVYTNTHYSKDGRGF